MEKEKKEIDLIEITTTIWKSKDSVIKYSLIGLCVGIVVAFSIPKQYTSILKVAPEGGAKGASQAGGLAAMMGVNLSNSGVEGINENYYPEIISSTPFLLEFADIEVYYDEKSMQLSEYMLDYQKKSWWKYVTSFPMQAIGWVLSIGSDDAMDTLTIKNSPAIQYGFKDLMSSKIKIEKDKQTGILKVASTFQDPTIAKVVLDTLVVKLQTYMTKYRTARTSSLLESNKKMMNEAREKYYEADMNLAEASDRNRNLISKSAGVKLDRLQDEKDLAFQVYQQLALQVETDRVKLQEDKPIVTIIEPATTPILPSSPNKLLIFIAFAFLGGFVAAVKVMIKYISSK